MANNTSDFAPLEHIEQGTHRARSSSLPSRDRASKGFLPTRSRSTSSRLGSTSACPACPSASHVPIPYTGGHEPQGHTCDNGKTFHSCVIDMADLTVDSYHSTSQMMPAQASSHGQWKENFTHQKDIYMPDADAEAEADPIPATTTTLPAGASEQTPPTDLLAYMEIDPTIQFSDESLREMAAEIYGPPSSPELPLLQTVCQPASSPLEILGTRSVQPSNSSSLRQASLPLQASPYALVKDAAGGGRNEDAPSAPLKTTSGSELKSSQESHMNAVRTKRLATFNGEAPAKKAKIEESKIHPVSIQIADDDDVEILTVKPVRRSTRQNNYKATSSQPKKSSGKTAGSALTSKANSKPNTSLSNWTKDEYRALAQALWFSFPTLGFEKRYGKTRNDIAEIFGAVIQAPLLAHTDLGDRRVAKYRGQKMHQEYQERCQRDLQQEKERLRPAIEADVWRKMQRDGWVKLEQAKGILAETEKQVEELNASASRGPGRRGSRVLTVEEATEELQAASAELEKAKKAEQRKAKRIEKKGVQSQGRGGGKKGKFDDDAPGKSGPKSGCGKGKYI